MAFLFDNLAGSNSTAVMGIINLSPDSFYSRSSQTNPCDVFHAAEKMIHDGVHIIDVGAESTRPVLGVSQLNLNWSVFYQS